MKNFLNRYFADELTSDEKRNFLQEVDNSEELKEEFIENQNLVVLLDWTFPENVWVMKMLWDIMTSLR